MACGVTHQWFPHQTQSKAYFLSLVLALSLTLLVLLLVEAEVLFCTRPLAACLLAAFFLRPLFGRSFCFTLILRIALIHQRQQAINLAKICC